MGGHYAFQFPAVETTLFILLSHFICASCSVYSRKRPIHVFMDTADLQYHFGVNDTSDVPAYSVVSPIYHAQNRDFPKLSCRRNWMYPLALDFDLNYGRSLYTVRAVRNDALVSRNFNVKFYTSAVGQRYRVSPAEIGRHYQASVSQKGDKQDENAYGFNGAFSFDQEGIRGIFEASGTNEAFRILPLRRALREKSAVLFDLKEKSRDLHIMYQLPRSSPNFDLFMDGKKIQYRLYERFLDTGAQPTAPKPYALPQNSTSKKPKKKKKKKKGRKKGLIKASMKFGVLVDYSVYRAMLNWDFADEKKQIFYILSFYNEIQLMYQEKKLAEKIRFTISLQSLGFFTSERNDLGADPYATQYIDNICQGPYNDHNLDHIQALTFLDIFDKTRRRKRSTRRLRTKLDLPVPVPVRSLPGYQPIITNLETIPAADRLHETIGLAYVGGTCAKDKHCSVVEMNTPIPSFSGAHEIGHAVGMTHEEDSTCSFNPRDEGSSSFMAAFAWGSNGWAGRGVTPVLTDCAVKDMVKALKSTTSCLVKKTADTVPGNLDYVANFRDSMLATPLPAADTCKLVMGELWLNFRKWTKDKIKNIFVPETKTGDELCRALECKVTGVDMPKFSFGLRFGPALPGTICSSDGKKVCFNFKCTDRSLLQHPQ